MESGLGITRVSQRVAVGFVLVVFAVLAASASAAPTSHHVDTTATAQATFLDVHSGMAACWNLQGHAIFPGIGRTNFTGQYCTIGPNFVDGSFTEETTLRVSKDGSEFTIGGSTVSPTGSQIPPPGTWTVTDAFGRFAGLSGSGTLTFASLQPSSTLTLTLAGTLTR